MIKQMAPTMERDEVLRAVVAKVASWQACDLNSTNTMLDIQEILQKSAPDLLSEERKKLHLE